VTGKSKKHPKDEFLHFDFWLPFQIIGDNLDGTSEIECKKMQWPANTLLAGLFVFRDVHNSAKVCRVLV